MRRLLSLSFALTLSLFLAACDSAEERADKHFQNALTLMAEGDADRAIVELRNVFPLVPNHFEARHELARILLEEKGYEQQAYGEYLRIVEQYPDDLKSRIELAEISFFNSGWEEFVRHGTKARELEPENPRVQIISAALDYRDAVNADDNPALAAVVGRVEDLMNPEEPNRILQELILDAHLRDQKFSSALDVLDDLSAEYPEMQRYWRQRLQILLAIGDQSAVEEQLIDLVERFPEDAEQKQMLVRYYLSRQEFDKTEAFLRDLVAAAPEDGTGPRIDLIRFLIELRSVDEARAEIADAIATQENTVPFILMGTALDFATGNQEAAIADLEAAIDAAEPSDETNSMKVSLARMLLATGNEVGARALIEAVLAEDSTQTGALKIHAAWLIDADDTDGAIAALRVALDADPEDPETLTLMADAYARTGSTDLVRDFLSLAVEESGNAPAETLRYAQLLISEERYLPAEDILLPALRLAPNNLQLLQTTGQLYLRMNDLGRVRAIVDTLNRIGTPEAERLSIQIEADRLNRMSGAGEAVAYLERLAGGADADLESSIMLLRARLSTGDTEGAIALAESIIAEQPDSPQLKLLFATTLAGAGELERALEIYDELEADFPDDQGLPVAKATLLVRSGQPDEARATIEVALERMPDSPQLLWASASYLEQDGDIEGAIAVYEDLYAQNSNSIVVANNLASLIGTYRTDDESLDRAWTIARRFRDADLPQIQDTYGWISHRRGQSEDALPYVESAAAQLQDDPIVQYHLAEVLYALGRTELALEQYRTAVGVAGVGDSRPQIAAAAARIAEIESALEASE